MKKYLIPVLLGLLLLASCSTVNYMGPRDFVSFHYDDNIKSSEQKTLDYEKETLVTSYDHEFTYDAEGHLLKIKKTEYFDRTSDNPQFAVWETEWKVIGDKVVPFQASVNGEVYCILKYDLLDVDNNGVIKSDIAAAFYYKFEQSFFKGNSREFWEVSLENYPVPFKSDSEFVKTIEIFNYYSGYKDRNVLNLGFDNIILTSYKYSYDKLYRGIAKSLPYQSVERARMENLAINEDVDFNLTWKSIADKPCVENLSFIAKDEDKIQAEMKVIMDYNSNGNRINEKWLVIDNSKKEPQEITVFEQTLSY
ncbi:MAG: hypothetical protein JXR70_16410 [Spirochaetales bacterium]|nr:hypothetical protein [Spirochaetales bacterium]